MFLCAGPYRAGAVHVFLLVIRVVPKRMHIRNGGREKDKGKNPIVNWLCVCISWGRVLGCWSGSVTVYV
jgi:hypothetical protein